MANVIAGSSQSDAGMAFDRLEKAVELCRASAINLIDRTDAMMLPQPPPSSVPTASVPVPMRAPLVAQVHALADRLENTTRVIDDALARLSL